MTKFGDRTIEEIRRQRPRIASLGKTHTLGAANALGSSIVRHPLAATGIAAVALGTGLAARRLPIRAKRVTRPGLKALWMLLRWKSLSAFLDRLRQTEPVDRDQRRPNQG